MNLHSWATQLGLMIAAFVGVTAIAMAFGAANLGTAATIGTLAFAATYVWFIAKE